MRLLLASSGKDALDRRTESLIKLIAYTGCRPGEIKRLKWAEVDLDRQVLRLQDAKTGDRSVWLNGPASTVVENLEPVDGAPWVFPSPQDSARPIGEFTRPWRRLLELAEIDHAPPYVLRHTFASESEACGNSPFMTAALLGHSMGRFGSTGVYIHHIPSDVREASERVGQRIAAPLEDRLGAQVLSIRKA
jgi:integrase